MKKNLINLFYVILLIFSFYLLNEALSRSLNSKYKNEIYADDSIKKNDLIVVRMFTEDTIKTFSKLKEINKKEDQFNITLITREQSKINRIFEYMTNLSSLYLHSSHIENYSKFLQELVKRRMNHLVTLFIISDHLENVPYELIQFHDLKSLYIASRTLSKFPEFIFNLHSLVYLNFTGCKFNSLPIGINKLKNLEQIVFHDCLVEILSEDFNQMNQIEKIDFNFCTNLNIEQIIYQISQIKHTLKSVSFFYCNVSNIPENIALLTNVEQINIILSNKDEEYIKKMIERFKNINLNIGIEQK